MSIVISPNMLLPVPGVGSEAGPAFATDINNCLSLVDTHDHSPGKGVQVTPNGLNINSSLSLNGNTLTNIGALTLTAQGTTPAINTVYESGVDLWYVDGNGNNVQITNNGSVAGSSGSIANLASPASATYVSSNKTFVWQSDVNTPANMDAASLIIRNLTASSNGITLQAPGSLGSNYSLTLPAVPGSLSLMALDSGGNMSAPYSISGGLNASVLTPASITTTQIASATILGSNIAATTISGSNMVNSTVTGTQIASSVVLAGVPISGNGNAFVTMDTFGSVGYTLGIVRGTVNGTTGAIIAGEGFTSTRTALATYQINLTNGFVDLPSVTANGINSGILAGTWLASTAANNFVVRTYNASNGAQTDLNFSFIAIGRRS